MRRPAFSAPLWLPVLLVLPTALGGCMHATTYGTGEMPEMALFREVSGGLLDKNNKKQAIDYQPRAPLVLPAAADQLPPPADTAAAADPNWPVDRDQLKAEADARANDGDPRNDVNQAEYRRLKPLAGAFPSRQRDETFVADDPGKDDYYRTVVHGKQQRQQFAQAVADSKGYGRTTERKYLTDPPIDYREPVANAEGAVAPVEPPKGNILTRWWHRK